MIAMATDPDSARAAAAIHLDHVRGEHDVRRGGNDHRGGWHRCQRRAHDNHEQSESGAQFFLRMFSFSYRKTPER